MWSATYNLGVRGAKCLNNKDCRVSSAVEQRFCKPLVGSSILTPGTNKIGKIRLLSPFSLRRRAVLRQHLFYCVVLVILVLKIVPRGRFDQDQQPVTQSDHRRAKRVKRIKRARGTQPC